MKLVELPKGRQQAIHGPSVNVPTNLEHMCAMLPRLPKDSEIVPVKLKRKLVYKDHVYEYIRAEKVMDALLKDNNKFYDKTHMHDDREDVWNIEEKALWEALTTVEEDHSATREAGGNLCNLTDDQDAGNLQPSITKSAPNSDVHPSKRQHVS